MRAIHAPAVGLVAAAFACAATGCAAKFEPYPVAEAPLCGGAVCFEPTDVRVSASGDDLVVSAWHASDEGCALPHGGAAPLGGTAIEVTISMPPTFGAKLPVVEGWQMASTTGPHVSARAFRIDGRDGRAVSDEEAMAGEATILELDPATRRARIELKGRWSSGVEGTMQLTWDEASHPCGP